MTSYIHNPGKTLKLFDSRFDGSRLPFGRFVVASLVVRSERFNDFELGLVKRRKFLVAGIVSQFGIEIGNPI